MMLRKSLHQPIAYIYIINRDGESTLTCITPFYIVSIECVLLTIPTAGNVYDMLGHEYSSIQ